MMAIITYAILGFFKKKKQRQVYLFMDGMNNWQADLNMHQIYRRIWEHCFYIIRDFTVLIMKLWFGSRSSPFISSFYCNFFPVFFLLPPQQWLIFESCKVWYKLKEFATKVNFFYVDTFHVSKVPTLICAINIHPIRFWIEFRWFIRPH